MNRRISLLVILFLVGSLLIFRQSSFSRNALTLLGKQEGENTSSLEVTDGLSLSSKSSMSSQTSSTPDRFKDSVSSIFDSPDSREKLESLDREFGSFINKSSVKRTDKIEVLMELLNSRSENQALYILDNLAHLSPIEKAPELINMFTQSDSPEFKAHVLTAIRNTLITDWDSIESEKPSSETVNTSEKAIFEFYEKLAIDGDEESAKYTVMEISPLLPSDAQDRILTSLDSDRMEKLSITPLEIGNLYFDLAITNADDRSMSRFRELMDKQVLESDSEFMGRVLSTLRQVSNDSRYRDFSREVLARAGDLTLSPSLFVKSKEVELALNGVPEEKFITELSKLLETSSPIERAAIIIGSSGQVMAFQDESSKVETVREFLSEAEKSTGTSKEQLLVAGLSLSETIEDTTKKELLEKNMCKLLGKESGFRQCSKYV